MAYCVVDPRTSCQWYCHRLQLPTRHVPLRVGQAQSGLVSLRMRGPFTDNLSRTRSLSWRSFRIRSQHAGAIPMPFQPSGTHEDAASQVLPLDTSSLVSHEDRERKPFKNKYMNLVRFGSIVNDAAESFFKSEIRRRLFVTAALLILSRVGYFIPLPGFDRRLMPRNYLSFVYGGSADELGDYAPELKMSLFQLGISPQIMASILMQVLCHVVPSLIKLRKEGLDGHEKIKSYMSVPILFCGG